MISTFKYKNVEINKKRSFLNVKITVSKKEKLLVVFQNLLDENMKRFAKLLSLFRRCLLASFLC